jgi:hypothetical protein
MTGKLYGAASANEESVTYEILLRVMNDFNEIREAAGRFGGLTNFQNGA